MTIKELLEVMPALVSLDITVRDDNLNFLYRYHVEPYAFIPSGYPSRGYELQEGEIITFADRTFPAMFVAFNPHEAGDEIVNLKIRQMHITKPFSAKYRHYEYKGQQLGGWESEAVITASQEGWVNPVIVQRADLKNQMNISDYMDIGAEK